ncbi:MAG: basic secretory protein-like protein [Pseudomonadota bacterium]
MLAYMLAASLAAGPEITIQPDGDALVARYTLSEPVPTFGFAPYDTPQRRDAWSPITEDWDFDGATVTRTDGAEFSDFSLRLVPDPQYHDRRNVVLSRIGQGWALYLAALGGLGEPATVRFKGFSTGTVLRLGNHEGGLSESLTTDGNDRRVAYIGPLTGKGMTSGSMAPMILASPSLPEWAGNTLQENAVGMAELLKKRLGAPAVSRPLILVAYNPDSSATGTKGGALGGATIQLNLQPLPVEANEEASDRLAGLIAHEMVHLWINEVWDTTENSAQPWLHEGAAEYLAVRWLKTGRDFQNEAGRHLADCVSSLRGRPLDGSDGPLYGGIPYNCGFSLHLVAEQTGIANGRGDVLDLWRAVVNQADEGRYDSRLFLAIAAERGGPAFDAFANVLLRVQGGLKPLMLGQALENLGLLVASRPPDGTRGYELMQSALRALGRHYCRGSHGWWTEANYLRMDTGDRCGPFLPGDPHVSAVNGVGLTAEPYKAYLVLRQACDAGASLTFATPEGEELPAFDCDANMAMPAAFAELDSMPNLPRLR